MRNKNRIQALETQVSELSEQVAMLLEVMTRPERKPEFMADKARPYSPNPRTIVNAPNRLARWTKEDVELAISMRSKGASAVQIGKVLGRSHRSVSSMFVRYGLA